MTLRELHARLAQIMDENEKGGPETASRNDMDIMIILNRTGRKRSWYYPIKMVSDAIRGVHLIDLTGDGGPVDIIGIAVDSVEVRHVKPPTHYNLNAE